MTLLNNYLPGDVNADDRVDMIDMVLLLQIFAGIQTDKPVFPGTDINGDAKTGLAELIFIIRSIAGFQN